MAHAPEYYGGSLAPNYVRDLTIVHRNACHLQSLVDDVLDLARIETAQMSVLPEETDPTLLVQEAVSTVRSLVEARGLVLLTDIGPDLPKLWIDPVRIRQVLFNLLNNAARFTDSGSVTVGAHREGDDVIFKVADTGVGIADVDVPRLFEEFHQLDRTMHRRHGGAGLGLAISRRFVELHGGHIWVESRIGKGSTFFFSLPVARREFFTEPEGRLHKTQSTGPGWQGEERVLLAATRSASAALLLSRYLQRCRTVIVQDLEQAKRAAQQLLPQGIVIDSALGEPNAATLDALVQDWNLANTPYMICPLPGEGLLRQRLAVDGYLVKPVSQQNLWDILRQFPEEVDNVLIIDDDRDFVRLLGRMLESPVRRYQVLSAYSGHEGLGMLEYRQPDLVLLDMALPDMDGTEVISQIRAHPAWRAIPIVVISGRDQLDTIASVSGPVIIDKATGLRPGELVQWVQNMLDTTSQAPSSTDELKHWLKP
jgi:CheY-like chemotaxis protein